LLTSVDIKAVASEKLAELLAEASARSWAACAAIWSRVFVLSGPGWERAPETAGAMGEAFSLAMQRAAGMGDFVPNVRLVAELEAFDVADDGSAEWQYMIYLMGMVQMAVRGKDLSDCLSHALQMYLEMSFHMIGRTYGAAVGRPLSWKEAKEVVAADDDWARTVDFVRAL
jgi:hypothetical protein